MQHDAGPARPEHDVQFARRRRDRFEIDQRLPYRIVYGALPGIADNETLIALAAAIAVAAGLLPCAVADHDRDAQPNQRPHVAIGLAVGTQNFDRLPGCCKARRDLSHARILGASIGVEGWTAQRAFLAVELHIGAPWWRGIAAAIAAFDRAHRIGSTLDRRFRDVRGMRVADSLVLYGAQSKALRSVISRLFQPTIIEGQHFGLAVFQEQFTVIGTVEPARDDFRKARPVEAGTVDKGDGCIARGKFLRPDAEWNFGRIFGACRRRLIV